MNKDTTTTGVLNKKVSFIHNTVSFKVIKPVIDK